MNRKLCLTIAIVVLALAWLGPLPSSTGNDFSAHMLLHLIIICIAAPLLAAGIDTGRFRFIRNQSMLAVLWWSLVDFFVIWSWHTPILHTAAGHSSAVFALEQSSYLIAGLLLWISAATARHDRSHLAAGIAALLFTSMHMTLLGVLLAVADRPLYSHTVNATALQDQQLGGLLMLGAGGTVYLAAALFMLRRLLQCPDPAASGTMRRDPVLTIDRSRLRPHSGHD